MYYQGQRGDQPGANERLMPLLLFLLLLLLGDTKQLHNFIVVVVQFLQAKYAADVTPTAAISG